MKLSQPAANVSFRRLCHPLASNVEREMELRGEFSRLRSATPTYLTRLFESKFSRNTWFLALMSVACGSPCDQISVVLVGVGCHELEDAQPRRRAEVEGHALAAFLVGHPFHH